MWSDECGQIASLFLGAPRSSGILLRVFWDLLSAFTSSGVPQIFQCVKHVNIVELYQLEQFESDAITKHPQFSGDKFSKGLYLARTTSAAQRCMGNGRCCSSVITQGPGWKDDLTWHMLLQWPEGGRGNVVIKYCLINLLSGRNKCHLKLTSIGQNKSYD